MKTIEGSEDKKGNKGKQGRAYPRDASDIHRELLVNAMRVSNDILCLPPLRQPRQLIPTKSFLRPPSPPLPPPPSIDLVSCPRQNNTHQHEK